MFFGTGSSRNKLWLLSATALLLLGLTPAASAQVVITGVFDGPLTGGIPKAVEVYVVSDVADLSIYGIGSANNGGGSNGEEFTFPAGGATAGRDPKLPGSAIGPLLFSGGGSNCCSIAVCRTGY